MTKLNSRWARADAPGAADLKALLDQLQVGQRLRVADGSIVTPPAGTAAPQPTSQRRGPASAGAIDLATRQLQRAAVVDTASRECELSFSSETPYERWWGIEVLGHKTGEVDLSWIGSGYAPLLKDHEADDQIGIVPKAWLGGDGKARATVRFGKSACAEEQMQDVADGVRVNVSVGYEINELELVKVDGETRTYRVTDWLPLEISLVSIPADMTVGVGRSASTESLPAQPRTTAKEQTVPETTTTKPAAGDEAFRAAVRSITTLADAYAQWVKPGDVAKAVADNTPPTKAPTRVITTP